MLVELATDLERPAGTRAFAIVGLGALCEERSLPWRSPLVQSVPYVTRTVALSGDSLGLIDLF